MILACLCVRHVLLISDDLIVDKMGKPKECKVGTGTSIDLACFILIAYTDTHRYINMFMNNVATIKN